MARSFVPGLLLDASVCIALFLHWITVGIIVDATGNNTDARKAASVWLAVATIGSNVATIGRSYVFHTGRDDPKQRPESIFGLFCEIVSLAQGWGTGFCVARVFSLEADHPFQSRPFLHCIGNSVFEMSLVQAGVGWAAEAPITLAERISAWCAAYLGGVLGVNLFLVSLVFGRRGWWNFAPAERAYAMIEATQPAQKEGGMARVGEWQLHSLGR